MKKIMLWAWMALSCFSSSAQIQPEGTDQLGKLQDVTYDAFIPNKMYAATLGNHLVSSNDNGAHWQVMYSYPGSAFITQMKMMPGNQTLSFGTRYALHFFNLNTQTLTNTIPVPQSGVPGATMSILSSYSIYDAAGQIMVVDTRFKVDLDNFGKTFYTTDGGQNWTEIYFTALHNNVFINTVAISPYQPNRIFLGRGNGDTEIDGGLWISSNSGTTWTQTLTDTTIGAIGFNPDNPNDILVGSGIGFLGQVQHIYRSLNNGQNWAIMPITWTDATLNHITTIAFNPNNTNEIIALEENEIVRSFDNGATWSNLVYDINASSGYLYGLNLSFNPFDSKEVALSTDLFPLLLNQNTGALTTLRAPYFFTIKNTVAKYGDTQHLYYDAQGGVFHKNLNTGVTLDYDVQPANTFNVRRNIIQADKTIPGRLYKYNTMGFMGGILRISNDYGATYTDVLNSFYEDMPVLKTDPINSNIIYVCFRSSDYGSFNKLDITDLNNVLVTDIITPEIGDMGQGYVTGVTVVNNTLYITKGTHFFASTDGGVTWTEASTGLEVLVPEADIIWDLESNPFNSAELSIATNRGVFMSFNSGQTWDQVLFSTDVKSIVYAPHYNGLLVGSVWTTEFNEAQIVYTINHGQDWNTVSPAQLSYVQSFCMDFDFDGTTISAYLATSDLGVVKYVIQDLPLGVSHPEPSVDVVSLYPNPSTTTVHLVSAGSPVSKYAIYSVTGQLVQEGTATTIDVAGWRSGVYFITVSTQDGTYTTKKLVKE